MQNIISYVKKNFNDKIVLEFPKNKTKEYISTTIFKLIGNKKVVLISEEKKIINFVDHRKDVKYILFFNDEYITMGDDYEKSYWVLKKTFECNFSSCVICLQDKELFLTKLMCCGVCFCKECYDNFKKNIIVGKISPLCPICRKSVTE